MRTTTGDGGERGQAGGDALAQLVATTEEFHRRAVAAESLASDTRRDAALERARVAAELHDTVGQSLVGAHRFLEAARASLDAADRAATTGLIDLAHEEVLTALREMRSVIESLVPPIEDPG